MATFTRLYFSTFAAEYSPTTRKGAWDEDPPAGGSIIFKALVDSKGLKGDFPQAENGVTKTTAVNPTSTCNIVLVSMPLAAQTISGTVQFGYYLREPVSNYDWFGRFHLWVTQGDSDTARGTLLTDYEDTVEAPSSGRLTSAQTMSSVACSAGDRLVLELGGNSYNPGTTSFGVAYGPNSTGGDSLNDLITGSLNPIIGDGTGPVAAPWILFSNAITIDTNYVTEDRVSQIPIQPATAAGDSRVGQIGVQPATAAGDSRVSQVVVQVVTPFETTLPQIWVIT